MKIEIDYALLQKIADYYEFPIAAFFTKKFPKGKRKENLRKTITNYKKKFVELFDEFIEKI